VNLVPLSIVSMDDPEHTRQRRILSRGLTPRQVRTMTDHVRELTNSVIDEVAATGEIDFVSDLAAHVPLIVISELLGLDPGIRGSLYEWSEGMIAGEAASDDDVATIERAGLAFGEYTALVSKVLDERREDPRDDMLSILAQAYDAGELSYDEEIRGNYETTDRVVNDLSNDELLMFCVLLMVAGNETTRNAIAGGLRAFSRFPDQRDLLLADPTLIDSAVEEILRWTTPVLNFTRTVTGPVTLAGTELVEGDQVLLLYQSANRDDRVFDSPEEFRIDRDPNPHVAFGFGPHFCMGANLARMEIKVVFEELFRRLPDIAVVDPERLPDRVPSAFVAGLKHMPARFTPVGT
jgi:cytochrome P450 family 142 subfamily A polypeptide 1